MTLTSWNVRGLASTLPVLPVTAPSSDILLLTETWCEADERAAELVGFQCICVSRPWKHLAAARASGWSACYVKQQLAPFVKQWNASPDASLLWLQLDKSIDFERDLFICLTYVWHEGSSHYSHHLAVDAFDALAEDVAEIYSMGGHVLLCGDFNARTADKEDFVHNSIQFNSQRCV